VLQARELAVEVGGRTTLAAASFSLRPGDKVGLVGRNGAGKTSLLRVLAGEADPDSGLVLRSDAFGYLPQDPRPRGVSPDTHAVSHILSGRGLDEAGRRLERLHQRMSDEPSERNVARFTRAEEEYRVAGGYAADAEARRLAHGLGLPDDRLDLALKALSGGERRRVELARILFAGGDLLLLDEPTNHLDVDAKRWLMTFLRSYRGALLVISHDLDLLDESITRVLHLDEGTLVEYRGTYSQYLEARAADEERQRRLAARQEAEINRLERLADSMRGQTEKRARTAKTLDRRAERMRAEMHGGTKPATRRGAKRQSFRFPDPPHAGRVVLDVRDLTKGYGGPPVFEDVTFDVGRGERLLVMGLNGAGKTTLMRILAGRAGPDAGNVVAGHGASVGYYAQEHEGIVAGRDVLTHMREQTRAGDVVLRGILGAFGLSGDIAFQDAGTLSGGEKTKLALAQLVTGTHNVLLLDEPTNNLDPPSRDAIGDALARWPGAIVLVSHDAAFVERLDPHRVLLMPDGDLDYWSEDLLDLVSLA
jgi:ATPase subunit of ABC transporter with duplicated ATPase domains